MNIYRQFFLTFALLVVSMATWADGQQGIKAVRANSATQGTVEFNDGKRLIIDFYGPNIFRLFQDNSGGTLRSPKADPPAEILVDHPRKTVGDLSLTDKGGKATFATSAVSVDFDKATGLMTVTNKKTGRVAVSQARPTEFKDNETSVFLSTGPQEYFYGGGVQNGRFSHKGKKIEIVNTNSWTDGGVCSPAPFYWSTNGYGVLCYTFEPGSYDFNSEGNNLVTLTHKTPYEDLFIMVDDGAVSLLNDYYQLTGNPVLLPKFAFYEGHLNAYNRDYWKETNDGGILFEDGKRYKESQKDNGGIKESLNGEKDNYQFSARAVVDRYNHWDMPLGWVLPNDGYGAGYGQTETLDGNIQNLKSFGDYARQHGVEVGLWTQSNLHPIDSIPALLQRDIIKEVRDAGVRVLKTDVAWVGAGYSFGLNGIANVAHVMPEYGNNARPFIITLDGWAGTQRYGGVWTGDQTGGEWEYIRFHIPTYIGAGLSGMGNITSDMDGIFGGKNLRVNVRDFQWKTFTPMQLNMDGWGANEKYPQALGEPATSINRNYLKLKSMLIPYTYSCAHAAVDGKPLIRAMMLDCPNTYTHGTATRYQYMYGPSFLVAPVYQETAVKSNGDDIRDGIYLPEGVWYDYFSGTPYQGGRVINNFAAPLWKLPVFVKAGAIIPMVNANNNVHQIDRTQRMFEVYPGPDNAFTLYDDDGTTEAYKSGASATTRIATTNDVKKHRLTITIDPTQGHFDGMEKNQRTVVRLNTWGQPKKVTVKVNGKKAKATTTYEEAPELNRFSTKGSEMAAVSVKKNPQLVINIPAVDITSSTITIEVSGAHAAIPMAAVETKGNTVVKPQVKGTPYTLTPKWTKDADATYYEIMFDSMCYSTIYGDSLVFTDLKPSTSYDFQIRKVGTHGAGEWTAFSASTSDDPLVNAIHGITATLQGARDMDGFSVSHLFDFATSGDIWHTHYSEKAVPFSLTMDLHCTTTLDKMEYLPRPNGGNGNILEGTIELSKDKKTWTPAGSFNWKRDNSTKTFTFDGKPEVRYIRMNVTKAVGDFGSGTEIYVYKTDGAKTVIPGDINQDGKIDDNDLTSYMNYTGLKKGDSDFDGYISNGDINGNGMIDAADISNVAICLDGGVQDAGGETLAGKVSVSYDKAAYQAGDDVTITVKGTGLKAVNALDLIMPYNPQQLRFVKIDPKATADMRNMTYDRHHTDGSQVLYPTFVNIGDQPTLDGDQTLFVIHCKALRQLRPSKAAVKGMLVDKSLNELNF